MDKHIELTHEEMKARVIKDANDFYNGRTVQDNDLVYDEMLKMIKEDEPDFDIYKYINYDVADHEEARHTIVFREFTKSADIADFDEAAFTELKKKYIVTPKFDGSSTVSYYNNGELVRILSRGDDVTGFVNTNKLRNKVPAKLSPDIKALLAEAVVPIRLGGRAKANGLVNSKYLQDDVETCLTLIPFDYQRDDGTGYPNTDIECSVEQIIRIRDTSEYEYHGEIYPCDGIVCYPREWSKFIEIHKVYFTESADTVLREIEWNLAWNSGLYHPVGVFDPVFLDGTNVERATLYNYQNLLNVGYRVNSRIKVIKANMTIPQIISGEDLGHKDGSIIPLEVNCPECGNKLEELGNDLICTNGLCKYWSHVMKWRIVGPYYEWNQSISDSLWQSDVTDYKFTADLLPDNWYDELINNINRLTDVLALPRLGAAKINIIKTEKGDRTFSTLDESLEFIKNYISWNQNCYLEKIKSPLKTCINGILSCK